VFLEMIGFLYLNISEKMENHFAPVTHKNKSIYGAERTFLSLSFLLNAAFFILGSVFHLFSAHTMSETTPVPMISEIMPQLYLSSHEGASKLSYLTERNIGHVLSLTSDYPCHFEDQIKYLHLPLPDTPTSDLFALFPQCIEFIGDAIKSGSSVLVHCNAGVSRSPTVVMAFVMHHQRLSLRETVELVRSRRACAYPNYGFMAQLVRFEKEAFGSTSLTVREIGVTELLWAFAPTLTAERAEQMMAMMNDSYPAAYDAVVAELYP
jgi:protein-tyrosine phosphatase